MEPTLNVSRLLVVTDPGGPSANRLTGDDAHISLLEHIRLVSRLPPLNTSAPYVEDKSQHQKDKMAPNGIFEMLGGTRYFMMMTRIGTR